MTMPTDADAFPRFLTVKEAADRIRRSEDTIYRRLAAGRYPNAKREGDDYLIPEHDLLASLEPTKAPKNESTE